MNSPTKSKLLVYLLAIFLAGGMAGGFLGYHLREDRQPQFRGGPPSPDMIIKFVHDKLVKEVGITEEQWTQIAPIVTNTTREIGEADDSNRQRIGELINQSDARIMELLDPEQKARMQKWIEDRQKHRGPGGGHRHKSGGKPQSE
jgi:Spy/CpxP family protein refolding chaperone